MSSSPRNTAPRPTISLNMAMSLDGKIATSNRAVSSFGSPLDHHHLYELRALSDAVMCGARTVSAEDADLGVGGPKFEKMRLRRGLAAAHLRVIVSGTARLKPTARLFSQPGGPIVVLVGASAPKVRCEQLEKAGAYVHVCGEECVDLVRAVRWLKRRWDVHHLHCEGGSELNDGLFRADLIDIIHLTLCPILIGGRKAPTISDGIGMGKLSRMRAFNWVHKKRRGDEHFLVVSRDRISK